MAKLVETPQEYIDRILSYVKGKDPRQVLETTAHRLRTIVSRTPLERLRRRPAPDRWSPAEIMAHLADAEVVGSYRIRLVLAQNGTPLQAYNQEDWAASSRYDAVDPADSIDHFSAMRSANLRLLDRVDPRLHDNYGMHQERGRETVTRIVELYAGHDLNHLGQVDRMLAEEPAGRPG